MIDEVGMPDTANQTSAAVAERWLARFACAVGSDDSDDGAATLFGDDCYWRDALALSWGLNTFCGADQVVPTLLEAARRVEFSDLRLDPNRTPPRAVVRAGDNCIEAFFTFTTRYGVNDGVVRLKEQPDGAVKAWTMLTALDQLAGYEERSGSNRPSGESHSRDFRGPNWLDQRHMARSYQDRDPEVLIVGGGQAGLSAAARLNALGIDALIIDKHARIGDNWRTRYHALTLHNQVQVNHLPYMPFPPNWPTYIPKDKLANWFEAYVEAMEINYWTGAELIAGSYDDRTEQWCATINFANGSQKTLRPQHIVMATGVSGIPNRPAIPTLENFNGRVLHSSEYRDGEDWAGKRALVIGTGNSGHDIAQDLTSSGADVTLVQRSSTLVVNIEPSAQIPYGLYNEGLPLADCDLIVTAMPTPLTRQSHIAFTEQAKTIDKPLLDALEQAGMQLDFGDDGSGWQFKYLTRGGGYYFNVGCSDMIASRQIRLIQFDTIEAFAGAGVRLNSGEELHTDLVVLATGYQPQEVLVEKLFGAEVARSVGPIWGFGDGMELRNMYSRTAQPGLWFIAGSLAQCRINSKYLALQIKACQEGLISAW